MGLHLTSIILEAEWREEAGILTDQYVYFSLTLYSPAFIESLWLNISEKQTSYILLEFLPCPQIYFFLTTQLETTFPNFPCTKVLSDY